ncbi:hypothetical protein TVAG_487780 [Trichomonas vaginalis G3]|uniref:DUF3447 domain-containing protein n=2 Tax=Trichomonas vaginalis (strain ATCC PRA-98 / G3) TaxID=412133 RepID=A2EFQ6_TRIV3|nr:protein ubiquitination [Trichomonas vaginalis G3]EAY08551.1 hypothetical protein TVAG_487780 [Trichomonas vaginalis G3]KAI5542127.1 protein ubiquitination [Trichomonas vaginalis G3]|eukprot:XP_001320774.1 hypothetical protein [Trichomonas vaginalis G3]
MNMREFFEPLRNGPLTKEQEAEEIENITQLQNLLMNLKNTKIEFSIPILKESIYYKDIHYYNQFISNVYFAAEYQPQSIPELAKLTAEVIYNHKEEQKRMCRALIKWGIYSHLAESNSELHSCRLCFIKNCLDISLFDTKLLVVIINDFWKTCSQRRYHLCRLFEWFAPQILIGDPTFFMHLLSIVDYENISGHLPSQFGELLSNFESLRDNNWMLWNILIKNVTTDDSIERILKNNDIIKLKEIISDPTFDINQRISPHCFEPSWFIQNHPNLIQYAAYFNSVDCFSYLIEKGCDVNAKDDKGNTLIDFCVAGNSIECFNLIKNNKTDFTNSLHIAALFHNYSLFQHLFRSCCHDLNAISLIYGTVINNIVSSNNLRLTKFYVENEKSSINEDLMRYAARVGSRDVLRYFLAMNDKLDINSKDENGKTALSLSAISGHFNIIHELLSMPDLDINMKDKDGNTALLIAAKNADSTSILTLMMSEKLYLDAQDNDGNTALHIGSLDNCLDVVKTLCNSKDINPNVLNKEGDAPIHIATRNPDSCGTHFVRNMVKSEQGSEVKLEVYIREQNRIVHVDILKFLVTHPKIDVNLKSAIGWSPLHYVARYGHYQLGNILYQYKMKELDVNIRDRNMRTPLHVACESGRFEMACFLIQPGNCNINAQDMFGQTPLHKAVLADNSEICHMMTLRDETDLNIQDKYGRTALMIAAIKGRIGSIRILARNLRINLDLTDKTGMTALQHAVKNGRKYCAELLRIAADLCDMPDSEDNSNAGDDNDQI